MTNRNGELSLGIVGGSGWLGGAMARAILRRGFVAPERLWISNRSGAVGGFEDWPGVNFTTRNQALAERCEALLLVVPPLHFPAIGIDAEDHLVVSVMAGVSLARIGEVTGASRVVRAMSNPAAEIGLAYSPWCAGPAVSAADPSLLRGLFEACGTGDEVPSEAQIDYFTALTGPVPGFLAYFADCMVAAAVRQGIDPAVAERAVRQLFHASGVLLARAEPSPAEQVQAMRQVREDLTKTLKKPVPDSQMLGVLATAAASGGWPARTERIRTRPRESGGRHR